MINQFLLDMKDDNKLSTKLLGDRKGGILIGQVHGISKHKKSSS